LNEDYLTNEADIKKKEVVKEREAKIFSCYFISLVIFFILIVVANYLYSMGKI